MTEILDSIELPSSGEAPVHMRDRSIRRSRVVDHIYRPMISIAKAFGAMSNTGRWVILFVYWYIVLRINFAREGRQLPTSE